MVAASRITLSNRSVFLVSVAVFVALGSVWALATPPEASPDEPMHTMHAAAVVRGDVGGRSVVTPSPGPGVINSVDYVVRIPESYASLPAVPACYAFRPDATADCAPPLGTRMDIVETSVHVGSYPPVYYALVGWPSLFLAASPGVYAIRFVSLLVCAALLASGVVAARETARGGAACIGIALAVTPMVVFLASAVNPNSLEVAAGFATWAGCFALLRSARAGLVSSGSLLRAAVPAVLVAWARPTGVVTLAIIAATAAVAEADLRSVRRLLKDRRVVVAAVVVGVAALGALCWVVLARSFSGFLGSPQPDLSAFEAGRQSLAYVPRRLEEMVGWFGWLDVRLPHVVPWVWGAAVLLLTVAGLWAGRARQRLAVVVLLAAALSVSTGSETLRAAEYGWIWQGRYSLPLLVGLPLMCAMFVDDRGALPRRALAWAMAASAVLVVCSFVLAHATSMRRYLTGVSAPLWDHLDASTWSPPLPPYLLLVGAAVTAAAYVGWLGLLAIGDPRAPVTTADGGGSGQEPGVPG